MTEKEAYIAMLDRAGIKYSDTEMKCDDSIVGGVAGVTQVSVSSCDGERNGSYPQVVHHAYGEGGTDFFFNTEGVLLSVLAWGQ